MSLLTPNKLLGPSIVEGPLLGNSISPFPLIIVKLNDNEAYLFSGDKPTESDIVRCNHRMMSNFGLSSDGKLRNLISNLRVVPGESGRDVGGKLKN